MLNLAVLCIKYPLPWSRKNLRRSTKIKRLFDGLIFYDFFIHDFNTNLENLCQISSDITW